MSPRALVLMAAIVPERVDISKSRHRLQITGTSTSEASRALCRALRELVSKGPNSPTCCASGKA